MEEQLEGKEKMDGYESERKKNEKKEREMEVGKRRAKLEEKDDEKEGGYKNR